jgi:hypothetical protein
MRTCNLALAEMTEALNCGWEGRDSRSVMLLQQERAGVQIAVDPERLKQALPTETGSSFEMTAYARTDGACCSMRHRNYAERERAGLLI